MSPKSLEQRLLSLVPPKFRAFVSAHRGSHRRFVGPRESFDTSGASQFNLLTVLGFGADTQSWLAFSARSAG